MRNANAAEWILRLVTTPERAASTTGDLLEEASGRSAFWFWSSTLRTAACHVWKDLWVYRGRMAWLGFSGLLAIWLFTFGVSTLVIVIWMAVSPYSTDGSSFYIPPWGHYRLFATLAIVGPLIAGWDVASRSKGRELAAALALTVALAASTAINGLSSGGVVQRIETPYTRVDNLLIDFGVMALSAMAGAMLFRLWSLVRGRSASGPALPR
ncbi:MAG: hypothetical protein HY858_04380 [Candidatus Solibacter usitatus]|nr:hypothetical protein [Candidatus Solibacter usitatus]